MNPSAPRFVIVLLTVLCIVGHLRADVIINEMVVASSNRALAWDSTGSAVFGTGVRWYQAGFDESPWLSGPGPFGYGTISGGPVYGTNVGTQMQYLTPTLYLRKTIEVAAADASRAGQLQLTVNYNDGFICYLNGVEVARRWAGPARQFHFHDQPAYNPNLGATATTGFYSETINLGAASARLNAGANLLAIHALNITATNTTFLFKATLAINDLPSIALLGPGESWKYLPGVVEPSGGLYDPALLFAGKLNVSWGSPTSYDDSAWGSGPGPLGAGPASGAATLVPGVIDQTPSLYARAIFNVTEAQRTDNQPLRLLVDYDDSFIAYLNGVEVARANLGAAPNTFTPAAAVANGSRNKTGVQTTFLIDPPSRLLKEGPNVLAFQVHNVSIKDSDLYLKADLHTSAGEALVVNTQTWKYLAGTAEPVTTEDDGTEESPSGPDYAGDWIELQNTHQTEAVLLSGWQLSDEPGNPNKWVFPDGVSIAPGGYLVVFCDGLNSDLRAAGGFLHANFKLSEKGDYLALRNRSGLLVHDFSPAYPRGSAFHSYGVNAAGQMRFFDKATPGAANAGMEFEGIINDPAFSLPEGFYTGPQSLVLSCATPGASIRYTVNGSEPTQATGTLYSGAISVTGTMAIRARAFKEGMIASRTASKTYLVNQPVSRRSLPAICLTADPDRSLFRPFGIFSITNNNTASNYISDIWHAANSPAQYNNANLRGPFIERPGNLQLLYPDGRRGFNIDCGLRTAGSPYSRPRYVFPWLNTANPNSVSPYPSSPVEKPQINAFFRDEIGGEPLEFPLFPGSAVTSFDSLRLRSGKNDISNPFVRDELTRRLFIDTGNVGVHGINTTLWVNGIYKGYYNPVERPRQTFFQNWFGSSKEWDVWVINDAAEGDNLMLQELLSYVRNHPQNSYANFQGTMARLDVANFIDYLLINLYEVMGDWPHNNYIMARERSANAKWVFTIWDGEGSFGSFPGSGSPTTRTNQFAVASANSSTNHLIVSSSPATEGLLHLIRALYTSLRVSPEFKMLFADRIQKHFFQGGALTDARILARKNALRDEMLPLIPGFNDASFNSWINGTGNITRYTTSGATNTPSRRQVLLKGYFDDTAGGAFIQPHFLAEGLFPATLAPEFSQAGGNVDPGFQLTLSNPNTEGAIHYSTDGTDPRAAGGNARGSVYTSPLSFTQSTNVKARVRNTNGEWSPLMESTFIVSEPPPLLISEIMYAPLRQGALSGDEFEFIELKNKGDRSVSLHGMRFEEAITFIFPEGTVLEPNAFAVLSKSTSSFNSRYPGVPTIGSYSGNLDNKDGSIGLRDIAGNLVTKIAYGSTSPWPVLAGGFGNSLVPIDPNTSSNTPAAWRASSMIGGSPGRDDPAPPPPGIVVNELLANSEAPQPDTVELHNPTSQPVDIGGWYLSDNISNAKKYRIPDGTVVQANGYLVLTEADFNANGSGFAFDANGEEVRLSAADSAGNLTGYSHGFSFGASFGSSSFGRHLDSVGTESFPIQTGQSFGVKNMGPLVGPVVISELMYFPAANGDEFIELRNRSNLPVPLFDQANPLHSWRISGIAYSLPAGITLQPHQLILITSLDESTWRAKYGTPAAVNLYGPYPGSLENHGERVSLQKPGVPYLNSSNQTVVPYITVDSLEYKETLPWPVSAAGGGASLERPNPHAYGGDPASWRASSGSTPGAPARLGFAQWQSHSFTPGQLGTPSVSNLQADPDHDGIPNLREFAHGLDPLVRETPDPVGITLANDMENGPYLTLQYRRSLAADHVRFFVDVAGTPGEWIFDGGVPVGTPINNGDGTETVTVRDSTISTGAGQRFIRLRIVGE